MLLPRVKDVFPEETISRGELDEPYMGPLLIGDNGVDVGPLREYEAKGRATGAFAILECPERPEAVRWIAPEANAPAFEAPYLWDPAKRRPSPAQRILAPGLYRLQVWSTPKGTPLPPVDSATSPGSEHLVVLVRREQAYQEAHREYDRTPPLPRVRESETGDDRAPVAPGC